MYVRATSSRLSRGRSTPTRRAIVGNSPSHPEVLRTAPRLCPSTGPGLRPGVLRAASQRPGMRYVSYLSACYRLALPLLVPRVRADDHNPAVPADDPALAADLLHTRLDLHVFSLVLKSALSVWAVTCIGRRSGRDSGRTGSARRPPGRRAGSGCSASASCR